MCDSEMARLKDQLREVKWKEWLLNGVKERRRSVSEGRFGLRPRTGWEGRILYTNQPAHNNDRAGLGPGAMARRVKQACLCCGSVLNYDGSAVEFEEIWNQDGLEGLAVYLNAEKPQA